tara:strand:- start:69238 stop:69774 length:537 start_codon:yes stop_codon:yes gene_type:complete
VLAGTIRRIVLTSIAQTGAFTPIFSPKILEETHRAIPRTYKNSAFSEAEKTQRADRAVSELCSAFPDALVTPENTAMGIELPDQDDVHVVQTAVKARAGFIVTENLRDFPPKMLAAFEICPINTDHFAELSLSAVDHKYKSTLRARLTQEFECEFADQADMIERLRKVGLKKLADLLM